MIDTEGAPSPLQAAADVVAGALAEVADALHAVRHLAAPPRPDRLGHASQPVKVTPGSLARNAFWLAQWRAVVPLSHLAYDTDTDVVTVDAHGDVELARDELAECPDSCGRWFWRLPDVPMVRGVRVARWDPCELEDRYAGRGWTPVEAA